MNIIAPLSGVFVPLAQVPDEVFSRKLVGDGISIDPTDHKLLAPIDGLVHFIHPARHALTIISDSGLEVMMHIGLETVQLKGEGFRCDVKVGQRVSVGQLLIEFDLDLISTKAKSLLTQVVITNPAQTLQLQTRPSKALLQAGQDVVMKVILLNDSKAPSNEPCAQPEWVSGPQLTCELASGIHARPAALLVAECKKYQSEVYLYKGAKSANAQSIVALLTLEVAHQDRVLFKARGSDAEQAVKQLSEFLLGGLEDHGPNPVPPPAETVKVALPPNQDLLKGVMASSGLAMGPIFQFKQASIELAPQSFRSFAEEIKDLKQALTVAQNDLAELTQTLKSSLQQEQISIFQAHLELLQDPELLNEAEAQIKNGNAAPQAWQMSYQKQSQQLAQLNNELLAGRAVDVQDIGERVLRKLLKQEQHLNFPANSILVCKSLAPSELVSLEAEKIAGLCTVEGGASSHTGILARSLGIPYLTALPSQVLAIENATPAILDVDNLTLKLKPTDSEQAEVLRKLEKNKRQSLADLSLAKKPAVTEDGHHLPVFANIGNLSDLQKLNEYGAEGIGLVRSEFLFLEKRTPPSELEQTRAYQSIVDSLDRDRPVIIRTLDVGGDKPLHYIPMPQEENPFLGLRGLRLSLKFPELFRLQIRALLKAGRDSEMQIMLPMVTSLDEVYQAKEILHQESQQLGISLPKVGIMIEVPAAAIMAEVFAHEVDFFSIGSNDLTQYTLAIDRGHPELAASADGLHPAVLRLIQKTILAAHQFGKQVGICGGIASDPRAIPILLGLGIDELSVSVPSLPAVKAQIRTLRKASCVELAEHVLHFASAEAVRKYVAKFQGVSE